jgi:3-hydroxymyristoyl/3-hydroxydecanoyl-(acyl carrier protein) dehydratase
MRYLLLDRITELSPPERARGVKCVALSDDVFEHHFPGHPVLPGALIVEALAQLGGVLLEATQRQRGQSNLHALLVAIDRAKFRHFVRPGDRLELYAETLNASEDGGRIRGEARLESSGEARLCAEAELTFAFARIDNPALLERRRQYLNLWLHGQIEDPSAP